MDKSKIFAVTILMMTWSASSHPVDPDGNSTPMPSSFVLKPVEDESKVPFEALYVQHPTNGNDADHTYNPDKKFVAIPAHAISPDQGIAANLIDNGDDLSAAGSDDDLVTAEAVVFRPLFRYRQQQNIRRRFYTDNGGDNGIRRRVYRYPPNNRYPAWYHNAEFPVLP